MVKTKNRIMFRNETKKHVKKPPHHTNTRKQYGGVGERALLIAAKLKAKNLLEKHREARVEKLKYLVLNTSTVTAAKNNLQKITGSTKKDANDFINQIKKAYSRPRTTFTQSGGDYRTSVTTKLRQFKKASGSYIKEPLGKLWYDTNFDIPFERSMQYNLFNNMKTYVKSISGNDINNNLDAIENHISFFPELFERVGELEHIRNSLIETRKFFDLDSIQTGQNITERFTPIFRTDAKKVIDEANSVIQYILNKTAATGYLWGSTLKPAEDFELQYKVRLDNFYQLYNKVPIERKNPILAEAQYKANQLVQAMDDSKDIMNLITQIDKEIKEDGISPTLMDQIIVRNSSIALIENNSQTMIPFLSSMWNDARKFIWPNNTEKLRDKTESYRISNKIYNHYKNSPHKLNLKKSSYHYALQTVSLFQQTIIYLKDLITLRALRQSKKEDERFYHIFTTKDPYLKVIFHLKVDVDTALFNLTKKKWEEKTKEELLLNEAFDKANELIVGPNEKVILKEAFDKANELVSTTTTAAATTTTTATGGGKEKKMVGGDDDDAVQEKTIVGLIISAIIGIPFLPGVVWSGLGTAGSSIGTGIATTSVAAGEGIAAMFSGDVVVASSGAGGGGSLGTISASSPFVSGLSSIASWLMNTSVIIAAATNPIGLYVDASIITIAILATVMSRMYLSYASFLGIPEVHYKKVVDFLNERKEKQEDRKGTYQKLKDAMDKEIQRLKDPSSTTEEVSFIKIIEEEMNPTDHKQLQLDLIILKRHIFREAYMIDRDLYIEYDTPDKDTGNEYTKDDITNILTELENERTNSEKKDESNRVYKPSKRKSSYIDKRKSGKGEKGEKTEKAEENKKVKKGDKQKRKKILVKKQFRM